VSSNGNGSVHNLESDTAPHDLNERVDDIDYRLKVVERLLREESRLASHSFASRGSLHMSDLHSNNNNNLSATQQIGNSGYPVNYPNRSHNGSANTVVRGHGPGGKRRKTKKQKKTKKRGKKGKKLTKRNRK